MLCALLVLPGRAAEPAYTMRGFDPRVQRGIDLIYNLRFDEAERHFEAVIEAAPNGSDPTPKRWSQDVVSFASQIPSD